MDFYLMQHNYRNRYLVVIIDANVYVYKNDKCKFDQAFLPFKTKTFFEW